MSNNGFIITHYVPTQLADSYVQAQESEMFSGVIRATCYTFNPLRRHFHKINPQV
jgi:hypothetical protein